MAPWVRTRLRAAPGAACALALLVALTACLAAAFPRAVDRYEDAGLRDAVAEAPAERTILQFYAQQSTTELPPEEWESALGSDKMSKQYAQVLAAVERPLVVDRAQSSYGVRTTQPAEVWEPWLPRPSGLPAQMSLVAQNGLADHSRLSTGRLPRTTGTVTARSRAVEAAVTAETAKQLRIKVGSVIHIPRPAWGSLAVRVTGIVTPREPEGAYWSAQPLLRTPSLMRKPDMPPGADTYWLGALLLPPDAAPALQATKGGPERYWQLAPSAYSLNARDLTGLSSSLASLLSGPGLREVRQATTDPGTDANTGLDEVLLSHQRLRDGIAPLVSVAAYGTGTVAAVVLLMAGGLAADRRRTELALLRARGGSLRGVTGRLVAETAVVAVPAGAVGLLLALLAVPTTRHAYAVAAAATVTLLACAALPLRAAARHAVVRVHGAREDLTSVRPSRRRTVAEVTLLVLALGAVVALRRRGTGGSGASDAGISGASGASDASGASADQLVSLAPVLVGVIAALVLVRLYPLPLRGLARRMGRLRGAVGHLSLARAGRTPVSAVLPLLALLTALTTAAFGGSVLAGIADVRDRAALSATGADARIESPRPLPAALPGQIRRSPGVREVSPVNIAYNVIPNDGAEPVTLVGVDRGSYASLARRTALGAFPAATLKPSGSSRSDVLPALASPSLSDRFGSGPFSVRLEDGNLVTLRISLVRETTPAAPGADFLVVDRSGLPGLSGSAAGAARPTTLLVTGSHLDAAALRTLAGENADVRLRSEARARYVDSPLQSGAERVYTAAVAAGAGYAALALLLTLIRSAPERAALLARLRTMGLTRAQGRRLLILESLPQALLAALGGTLAGWAVVGLLSPGIDLTSVALATATDSAPADAHLRTDPWSLLVPALTVVTLTTGIAAAQAWWTGRRSSVRELRAGDPR
ncbi:ABC transporter permease [Streptomyces spongiae]|uniref:ABC transporter permease n=1 Tax=Streptomyces spongiae TaxID=565072 RepID=A0A5N8XFZ2_9ACTN|nr:ABC transporter permease [Streptomyces spongiae]MPY58359.1 ABC transporter permease [Streptomyces spongiae]